MAGGNIIVSNTVNKVTWQVDQTAYGRALKQVKSLKREWESVGASLANKSNPAARFQTAAAQAKLVAKRLAQTERAEQAKSTAHSIAMAKKEASAKAAIAKIESARRKDAVRKIYNNRDPESQSDYNALRDHFKRLQKENGPDLGRVKKPINIRTPAQRETAGVEHFGRQGQQPDPNVTKRQNDAMERYHTQRRQEEAANNAKSNQDRAKARAKQLADIEKETASYRQALSRREVVVGNAQRRLEGQLGPSWRKKVKGFDTLSESLKLNAGSISEYNSQIGQMIRQAKAGQSATMSFNDGVKSLRRSLISVTAAYSAFNAAASIMNNGQFFQSMSATMLMVSKDSVDAGKKMEFVQGQAYRLGLDLKTASQGYTQMAVSAKGVISDSDTNKLFTSLSEFATASGADAIKYQRGITAIGQMLGKGQIQAEELKGQLSEALPGSMQAFVNAAQKYFKDDKIGVPELQDLMKEGKLLAKDILPLVAQEFAEAARHGGALAAQLKSNRVAMQRMKQSWMLFQNEIFDGGFGKELTDLFNMFAQMLSNNGPAGKALGEFAGGFISAMKNIIAGVYDAVVIVTALVQKWMKDLGIESDKLDGMFHWAGAILGTLIFINTLRGVLSLLWKIAGMKKALEFLTGLGGTDTEDEEETGKKGKKGKKGKPKTGGKGLLGGLSRKAGLIGLLLTAADLLEESGIEKKYPTLLGKDNPAAKVINDSMDFVQSGSKPTDTITDSPFTRMVGSVGDWMSGLGSQHRQDQLNYLQSNGLMPNGGAGQALPPQAVQPQPVEGEIRIILDAGQMKDMIDQQIEVSNMGNINLITGVPN